VAALKLRATAVGFNRTPIAAPARGRVGPILLSGAPLTAVRTHAMGLVSEVVPAAEVAPRALAIAHQLARGPQQALQFIKEAVIAGMNLPLDRG
jgi:enoyl-CoA hydratase